MTGQRMVVSMVGFAAFLSMLAISNAALALTSLMPGLHRENNNALWGPKGLSLVRKSPYHVFHSSGFTEVRVEDCAFQADLDGLNQLLRDFSKVEMEEQHFVLLRPRGEARIGNPEFEANASLRNPNPADRKQNADMTLFLLPPVPTLTLYIDDVETLRALHFSKNLTLIHPAEFIPKIIHELQHGRHKGPAMSSLRRLGSDAKPAAEALRVAEDDESLMEWVRQAASETLESIAKPNAEYQRISEAIKALLRERKSAPIDDKKSGSEKHGE